MRRRERVLRGDIARTEIKDVTLIFGESALHVAETSKRYPYMRSSTKNQNDYTFDRIRAVEVLATNTDEEYSPRDMWREMYGAEDGYSLDSLTSISRWMLNIACDESFVFRLHNDRGEKARYFQSPFFNVRLEYADPMHPELAKERLQHIGELALR